MKSGNNSSNSNKTAQSGGIGFLGLLTVAFVVLKLCGIISWSWLWVLAPIWIPLGLGILFLVGLMIVVISCAILNKKN